MFKKIMKYLLFIFMLALFIPASRIKASEENGLNTVNIYYFYNKECSHCAHMSEHLNDIQEEYDNVVIYKYDIENEDNYNLLARVADTFKESQGTTPFVSLGGKHYVGYNTTTAAFITKYVKKYSENEHIDVTYKVINNLEILESDFDYSEDFEYDIPILGTVNVKEASLFLITAVIGFLDGFNPCAMWVLIFLISMLIAGKDKKRMWLLGSIFLLTSSLVYFLMMIAWIETIKIISAKFWFQLIVGVFALVAGAYHLFKYIKSLKEKDVGCEVVDDTKRKKLVERIKKIVLEKKFILAALGIIVLAVVVNFIEIACSAGLPVLYSQILLLNGISGVKSIGYILLYIFFFLLDDLVVFTIAMFTLKVSGVTNKYTNLSHLIGGILMVIIGILMIFFPNVLMFNF